jgi:hypothetical protein
VNHNIVQQLPTGYTSMEDSFFDRIYVLYADNIRIHIHMTAWDEPPDDSRVRQAAWRRHPWSVTARIAFPETNLFAKLQHQRATKALSETDIAICKQPWPPLKKDNKRKQTLHFIYLPGKDLEFIS